MTTAEKKFVIDQLRKDKIIYAAEACATNLVCILGFLFSNSYFQGSLKYSIDIFILTVGVGYSIFMGLGNYFRLKEIKRLEKEL